MPKEVGKMNIGVLALQGSVKEHTQLLQQIPKVKPFLVKRRKEVQKCDGIILPGGESTAIGKLLDDFDLKLPLQERIKEGMPVWGTCAGMILLAKKIVNDERVHLGMMDIAVKRNAYGSQLDSFTTSKNFEGIEEEIPLVFIRAPYIEEVGEDVKVLCEVGGHIVAARQKNMLVTSFHPELTQDFSVHRYFVDMVGI